MSKDVFDALVVDPAVFAGFDEVWIFDAAPPHDRPSEIDLAYVDVPGVDVADWTDWTSGLLVALRDGVRLDWLTRSAEIEAALLNSGPG